MDLQRYVRDVLMRPLGNQPIAHQEQEDAYRTALPELERLARMDPDQVEKMLRAPGFGAADSHGRQFRYGVMLVEILATVDPAGDRLIRIALDPVSPWYVRRMAVIQVGRKDEGGLVRPLLVLLEDPGVEGEIRAAVVEAAVRTGLADALPILRRLHAALGPETGHWHGSAELLCDALTRLGEAHTLREQIEISFHPHAHRARETLESLVKCDGGLDRILASLDGHPDLDRQHSLLRLVRADLQATVRAWALSRLDGLPGGGPATAFLEALGDPDWIVCRTASNILDGTRHLPEPELHEIVENPALPPDHRLWAAYTLLRQEPELELPLRQIPGYPILVPGLPDDVRRTILTTWARGSERGTDVRWLVEALRTSAPDRPEMGSSDRLASLLEQAGLVTGEIEDYAEIMQQGHSTFQVLPVNDTSLCLSQLGRYATLGKPTEDGELVAKLARCCPEAGWTWIPEQVADIVVPGLNVYFFGERAPLPVRDLLFYWQD